jgi:hypothetical protein
MDASKAERHGKYEVAIITYENALSKANKEQVSSKP